MAARFGGLGKHACVRVLVLAAAMAVPVPALAGTFWYVSDFTGADANACNAPNVPCKTINGAIAKAQSGDVIQVTAGIYTGSGVGAVVRVDKDLIINGGWDAGFSTHLNYTILNGQHQRRGLRVIQGAKLEIRDVAIIWGNAPDGGGALVEGSLAGFRMFIVQNRALNGGGIYFNGRTGDYAYLTDSAIFLNEYFSQGGGLYIDGFRFIDPSAHVVSAGGVFNTTVSNNLCIASQDEEHGPPPPATGGGVYVAGGNLTATHATFAENTIFDGRIFTQNGAGITVAAANGNGGFAGLQNTLIADGCIVAAPGQIQSTGFNVERTNTCNLTLPQDRKNVNPLIYPPTVNPGPHTTVTHALSPMSPAIDWANPQWCTFTADQRGMNRPEGLACDVGAFERASTDPAMGFMTHPGRGFADADRCPTLSWNADGKVRHNPCRVDGADLIEAILGVVDTDVRGGGGRRD